MHSKVNIYEFLINKESSREQNVHIHTKKVKRKKNVRCLKKCAFKKKLRNSRVGRTDVTSSVYVGAFTRHIYF